MANATKWQSGWNLGYTLNLKQWKSPGFSENSLFPLQNCSTDFIQWSIFVGEIVTFHHFRFRVYFVVSVLPTRILRSRSTKAAVRAGNRKQTRTGKRSPVALFSSRGDICKALPTYSNRSSLFMFTEIISYSKYPWGSDCTTSAEIGFCRPPPFFFSNRLWRTVTCRMENTRIQDVAIVRLFLRVNHQFFA